MAKKQIESTKKIDSFMQKHFTKTFRVLLVIFIVLVLFVFWGWFEKQVQKTQGMFYVYRGDKAFVERNLPKAIDYYLLGTKIYPEHYRALYNLGNIYVVYENYYAAAMAYENAIKYKKDFAEARMNLGIISAEKLGDFDGAIKQYQEILQLRRFKILIPFIFNGKTSDRENKGIAYYNMGLAYRQKSIYEDKERELSRQYLLKSLQAYRNAVRILKKSYDARYNLALTYHLLGNYQQAGLTYCQAIELWPMNYDAHYNLAILLRHLKMYAEAKDELEKASLAISSYAQGTNNARYVFDVLMDTSSTLMLNDNYKHLVEKVDDTPATSKGITTVNGKIVATEELDRAILKNFKTCKTKEFFKRYQ